MSRKAGKTGKEVKEDEVVVETTPEEGQPEAPRTGKRTKKVPADGKRHRAGSRGHRESRIHGYHHLLDEEREEDNLFS